LVVATHNLLIANRLRHQLGCIPDADRILHAAPEIARILLAIMCLSAQIVYLQSAYGRVAVDSNVLV
jgi:hypothetical protein